MTPHFQEPGSREKEMLMPLNTNNLNSVTKQCKRETLANDRMDKGGGFHFYSHSSASDAVSETENLNLKNAALQDQPEKKILERKCTGVRNPSAKEDTESINTGLQKPPEREADNNNNTGLQNPPEREANNNSTGLQTPPEREADNNNNTGLQNSPEREAVDNNNTELQQSPFEREADNNAELQNPPEREVVDNNNTELQQNTPEREAVYNRTTGLQKPLEREVLEDRNSMIASNRLEKVYSKEECTYVVRSHPNASAVHVQQRTALILTVQEYLNTHRGSQSTAVEVVRYVCRRVSLQTFRPLVNKGDFLMLPTDLQAYVTSITIGRRIGNGGETPSCSDKNLIFCWPFSRMILCLQTYPSCKRKTQNSRETETRPAKPLPAPSYSTPTTTSSLTVSATENRPKEVAEKALLSAMTKQPCSPVIKQEDSTTPGIGAQPDPISDSDYPETYSASSKRSRSENRRARRDRQAQAASQTPVPATSTSSSVSCRLSNGSSGGDGGDEEDKPTELKKEPADAKDQLTDQLTGQTASSQLAEIQEGCKEECQGSSQEATHQPSSGDPLTPHSGNATTEDSPLATIDSGGGNLKEDDLTEETVPTQLQKDTGETLQKPENTKLKAIEMSSNVHHNEQSSDDHPATALDPAPSTDTNSHLNTEAKPVGEEIQVPKHEQHQSSTKDSASRATNEEENDYSARKKWAPRTVSTSNKSSGDSIVPHVSTMRRKPGNSKSQLVRGVSYADMVRKEPICREVVSSIPSIGSKHGSIDKKPDSVFLTQNIQLVIDQIPLRRDSNPKPPPDSDDSSLPQSEGPGPLSDQTPLATDDTDSLTPDDPIIFVTSDPPSNLSNSEPPSTNNEAVPLEQPILQEDQVPQSSSVSLHSPVLSKSEDDSARPLAVEPVEKATSETSSATAITDTGQPTDSSSQQAELVSSATQSPSSENAHLLLPLTEPPAPPTYSNAACPQHQTEWELAQEVSHSDPLIGACLVSNHSEWDPQDQTLHSEWESAQEVSDPDPLYHTCLVSNGFEWHPQELNVPVLIVTGLSACIHPDSDYGTFNTVAEHPFCLPVVEEADHPPTVPIITHHMHVVHISHRIGESDYSTFNTLVEYDIN